MSESTEYLVEKINETFEIYNAISEMETEVLEKLDGAIRSSFPSWVSGEWISPEEENLHEDHCINIIRKDWSYQNDKGDTESYIWTYLLLEGDDPIWKLFGLPDVEGENSVCIQLLLSEQFKQLNNSQRLIEEFDKKNQDLLKGNGFKKKGGRVNRHYEMEIILSNEDILNGLRDDNWDKVENVLMQAWKILDKVDWEFIKPAIKLHQDKLKK